MFGMRRYRIFLLVAALSAATIYWLSNRGSWDISELEQLGKDTLKHGTPHKPSLPDQVVEPILPPPPEDDILKPVDPLRPQTKISSRIIPLPTSSPDDTEPSSTSTDKQARPTTTGEELLGTSPKFEDEFGEEAAGRFVVDSEPDDQRKARWRKPKAHFPLPAQEIISLPSGMPQKLPKIQATFGTETTSTRKDRLSKLNTIKESFKHAWNGYKQYGMPHDEVMPVSKSHQDPFMGWGATLVDTLDTLWIMGLKQDFEDAVAEVKKIDFKTSSRKDIPLFETVIRYLGGLIAAYDISGAKYPVLLEKAEELAEILMGAFDTPNRMPLTFYNWAPSYTSQPHRANTHVVMAELGSLSVEMTRLAQITKKHEYYDAIARITDELEKWQSDTLMPGLWPLKVDASGCKKAEHTSTEDDDDNQKPVLIETEEDDINGKEPAVTPPKALSKEYKGTRSDVARREAAVEPEGAVGERRALSLQRMGQEVLSAECTPQGLAPEPHAKAQIFGIGGQADSTYEYLPKMYALLRGRNDQYRSMYLDSTKAIRDQLLFRPMIKEKNREILFAKEYDLNPKAKSAKKREEITYGVTHLSCFIGGMFGLGAKLFGIEGDMDLAQQLTDGCVWAYESMPTGVMAETAAVVPCPDLDVCAWNETRWHEALDPRQEERFAAVQAWNKNQRNIYERSFKAAMSEASVSSETDKIKIEANYEKRDALDEESETEFTKPSRTSPKLDFEDDETEVSSDASKPLSFVPKVALSHEKYVEARITEERLPPSYTNVFARHYGLRPEAIESVFYMYRLTGDNIWREKGWKMFEAVQSATQTEVANAMMKDVTSNLGELDDKMESFWLAETLKYFYLLFDEPEHISLDEYVLNTEAHPLLIPN
ncbi:hypothetical protein PMZ80_010194 [Knufia obscura]|uniref:alpha-1,2-Mannosidase n=2 Tax=Knufia TaxID=430999 RepID=A0AAN8EDB4_9EURO|nr:hypothetical protein PMZ80_010194 [Knufia obscura]KAK5952934.1 hypothetical protein OHC33_006055 [Knufia fluminis]